MLRHLLSFSAMGLSAILLLGLCGCKGGSGGGSVEAMETGTFVGTWAERPPKEGARANPRLKQSDRDVLFQVTFNNDMTFQMVTCDKQGNPKDPGKTAQGKWAIEGEQVKFTTSDNKLPGKLSNAAPRTAEQPVKNQAGDVSIGVELESGEYVMLFRK